MAEKEYIEREAAYPIAKKIVNAITNGEYHAGVFAYDIMDWIDDIPAADVRPVEHGKWKDAVQGCYDSPHVKCSVCGEYYWRYFDKFNFCPNCGADMRPEGRTKE